MLCTNLIANKTDIILYKGDSLDVEFTVNWEDGTPVDLATYNARFVVFNTSIAKDSTHPDQIIILTPYTNGKMRVMLVPLDTQTLTKDYEYTYDAEVYDQQGNVYTFAQGIFKVV